MWESEGVASVDMASVLRPHDAKCTAVAAAQVVFPTPPLPAKAVTGACFVSGMGLF